jgi:hypothetical protein
MKKMDETQKLEAVKEAVAYLRDAEEAYKNGSGEYFSVSLREVLRIWDYSHDEANEIIKFCAERGFDYCIDPIIRNKRSGAQPEVFACTWGIDQLRSRLEWVV